jgi:hypothetical protein
MTTMTANDSTQAIRRFASLGGRPPDSFPGFRAFCYLAMSSVCCLSTGSVKEKVEPLPGWDSTQMRPP